MKKIVPDPPCTPRRLLDLKLASQRIREALANQPEHPAFAPLKDTVATSVGDHSLFAVKAGIPAEHALVHLALLLKCAEEVGDAITEQGSGIEPGLIGSIIHSVEMARSVVDALLAANGADVRATTL